MVTLTSFGILFLVATVSALPVDRQTGARQEDTDVDVGAVTLNPQQTAETLNGVSQLVGTILQGVAQLPVVNFQNPFAAKTTQAPAKQAPPQQPQQQHIITIQQPNQAGSSVMTLPDGSQVQVIKVPVGAQTQQVVQQQPTTQKATTPSEDADDDDELDRLYREQSLRRA